ncbi:MAG: hypothetical protein ACRCUT_00370, partial [Spirochaetota bacterium]
AAVFGLEPYGGLNVITVYKDKSLIPRPGISRGRDVAAASRVMYMCLQPFTMGLSSIKRKAWKISSFLSGYDNKC